ncbi:MAG TPA: hypothetical protein VHS78_04335 [Candidatus Elarobacter sp.]|jgi:hypothetical protein|nr:hypothetical protein [Candidatus Elarobacter sp.]
MMQTQWPGLGPSFDLSSLDAGAGDGRRLWPGDGLTAGAAGQTPDGVARPWWNCGTGAANAGDPFGGLLGGINGATGGSVTSLMGGLVAMLQQLIGTLTGQNGGGGAANQCGPTACGNGDAAAYGNGGAPPWAPGGPQQQFQNADVSSTGDPHIATTGTAIGPNGDRAVDQRWDSMTSHGDLVHSNQIQGGYRVSTDVTQPDANGVTFNQSASVHTNFNQDEVTMNRDGSFSVFDDGRQVALGKGESATLSGGERVTENQDGSLVVDASNRHGGTISTTLRSTGSGVDVSTHAQDLALGGDAVTHGAKAPRSGGMVRDGASGTQPGGTVGNGARRHTTHAAPPVTQVTL